LLNKRKTRLVICGMRLPLFFAAIFSLSLVTGCANTPWTIVHEAPSAPYGKTSNMTIDDLTFDDLKVGEKTEAQYLSAKSERSQQSFLADKEAMTSEFRRGFDAERGSLPIIPAGIPGSQPFVVKPSVTFIEPGFFGAGVLSKPTEIRVTVDVFDPKGDVVDEIIISEKIHGTLENDPASGTRMREAAEKIGRDAAVYLKQRAGV
jgi:hypothetical protein